MIPLRWRLGLGLAAIFCVGAGGDPDLSGYKTVKEAQTREIVPPKSGHAGQTGYLGVSLSRDNQGRLVVEDVQAGSPAARVGIMTGDVLSKLDDRPVRSPEEFRETLQSRGPGEMVKLTLLRGENRIEMGPTLAATSRPRNASGVRRSYLGVVLSETKETEGVKIEEVTPDSPASIAGLKAGDQIFQIDGNDFSNAARLPDLLMEKKPGDELEVSVHRGSENVVVRPRLIAVDASGRPAIPNAAPGGAEAAGRAGRQGGGGGGQGPGAMTPEPWKKPVFRLGVIAIEFPDIKHNPRITSNELRDAILSEGSYSDKKNASDEAVHGSLNDYFHEQSAGALRLDGKVFDWVEVSKKRAEYILGSGTTNITAVLVDALEKVAARDGKAVFEEIDGFLFLYAGEPIRGNRGGVYYPHAGMIRNFQSKRWPYVLVPEGGPREAPIGSMVKEFGQMLGLPDLAARPENRGSEGLGAWCALSNPLKTGRPQHLNPWAKEKLGWLKPTVIDPTVYQKLILSPIEDAPQDCLKILVRSDGSEYFLLENRQKKGFDTDLAGSGLLIWRVVRDRPILEESHGVEGPTGPTVLTDSVPFPSPTNHAFTPETTPSSKSPLGGGFPVSITNIHRLPDGRVSFQIGYEYR